MKIYYVGMDDVHKATIGLPELNTNGNCLSDDHRGLQLKRCDFSRARGEVLGHVPGRQSWLNGVVKPLVKHVVLSAIRNTMICSQQSSKNDRPDAHNLQKESMFTKASSTIAAFILSTSVLVASPQGRDMRFERFKREIMPKVGKKITVVGVLQSGKLGWLVTFNEWEVNIHPVTGSDLKLSLRKMNYLNRFAGHTVEVTGTLRYFPEPPPTKSDRAVATPPEHFYFDVAEARVVSLSPPRSKRSKGRRGRKTSLLRTPPYNSLNRSAIELAFHRELCVIGRCLRARLIRVWGGSSVDYYHKILCVGCL